MFKRLLIAVAGYSAYQWWKERRAGRRGDRSMDPAE